MSRGERAVNEVISFALVFALIASTVSIVYATGFVGLDDARQAEQLRNAERAFDVLADNMADIHQSDAPSRATEIKLSDAQLEFGETTTTTVTVDNVGISPVSVSSEPIQYTTDAPTTIVYDSGATLRVDRDGAVMNDEPPFLFVQDGTEKTAVLTLVETRSSSGQSVGGDTTILVQTTQAATEVLRSRATPGNATSDPDGDGTDETTDDPDGDGNPEYLVTLTHQSTAAQAPVWLEYLNEEVPADFDARDVDGDMDVDDDPACELTADDTVTCSLALERLYATASRIDVSFRT